MEILIGILCGLVLSLFFSFGPGFFGLIQNSINYGFRKGVAFEIGINASDIFMVAMMLTLLKDVELGPLLHNPWVASIAGAAMITLGLFMLLRKPGQGEAHRKQDLRRRDPLGAEFPGNRGQGENVVILVDDLLAGELLITVA